MVIALARPQSQSAAFGLRCIIKKLIVAVSALHERRNGQCLFGVIQIVEALVFSMHNGKLTGPFDGFSTPDWDYIREIATKKALTMRSQGFIHPATLVPSELEYAEGYKAVMDILHKKMKPEKA